MKGDKMDRDQMKHSLAIGRALGLRPDDMSFEEPDSGEPLRCACGHLSTEHHWPENVALTPGQCSRQCACKSYHHVEGSADLARLSAAVVDAAVAWRTTSIELDDLSPNQRTTWKRSNVREDAQLMLNHATDALIAAREEASRG